jgi:outer membrane usher protein
MLCLFPVIPLIAADVGGGTDPPQILADLFVNGSPRGTASFSLDERGLPLFSPQAVGSILGGTARRETVDALVGRGTFVTVDDLEAAGIHCAFDPATLRLSLDVGPAAMESEGISLGPRNPLAAAGASVVARQPFSAITGIAASVSPRRDTDSLGASTTVPVDLTLSPAVNIHGLVLEGSSTMTWADSRYSSRIDIARAVLDFPSAGTRLTAGTVENRPVSFQGKANLIGASYNRESGFPRVGERYRQDTGDIVLDRRSSVQVAVNGTTVRSFTLEPGTYHLSDLPLAAGLNDVTLRIQEEGLPARELRFGVPFDPSMLDPGETDFSTAFGCDRETLSRPFGSAWYYLGLPRALEVGIDAEGTKGNYLVGLSALWASLIGYVGLGGDLDLSSGGGGSANAAWAAKASWRFSSPSNQYMPRPGVAAEYRSEGFIPPEATDYAQSASDDPTWVFSWQIGQLLPAGMGSVALYGDSTVTRSAMTGGAFQAGYYLTVRKYVSLSVFGGSEWQVGQGTTSLASIAVVISPPRAPIVQYRNDPVSKVDSVDASMILDREGKASVGAHYSSLMWAAEGNRSAGASGRRTGDIGEVSSAFLYDSYSSTDSSTLMGTVSASTSVILGGGRIALGNPRNDSFAMLVPDASLSDTFVRLSSADGPLTESRAGRAVPVNGLSLYRPFVGSIELPDSGPGKAALPSYLEFVPGYKSVTIIVVKLDSPVYANGIAVDAHGSPLASRTGELRGADGIALPGKDTFTDETGAFECYGLVSGDYSIVWSDGSISRFSIPAIADGGLVSLGTIPAVHEPEGTGSEPKKAQGGGK